MSSSRAARRTNQSLVKVSFMGSSLIKKRICLFGCHLEVKQPLLGHIASQASHTACFIKLVCLRQGMESNTPMKTFFHTQGDGGGEHQCANAAELRPIDQF